MNTPSPEREFCRLQANDLELAALETDEALRLCCELAMPEADPAMQAMRAGLEAQLIEQRVQIGMAQDALGRLAAQVPK